MIIAAMAARIRVREGDATARIGAVLTLSARYPGACPRTVAVELVPASGTVRSMGVRYRTTQADSGVIQRRPASVAAATAS